MTRLLGTLSLGLLLTVAIGCSNRVSSESVTESLDAGQQQESVAATDSTDPNTEATPSPVLPPPSTAPEEIVREFLNASRNGEDELAACLLSQKARQATAEAGLALDPPGTPTMQYDLGEVEYPAEEPLAAYVNSSWKEGDAERTETFEVVWILRKQDDGWRIAGMAARESADSAPTLLNFENRDDLERIKQDVTGEPVAERPTIQDHTARRPQAGKVAR